MRKTTCGDCEYYSRIGGTTGRCYRHPPVLIRTMTAKGLQDGMARTLDSWAHPMVDMDYTSCGDFREAGK